MSHFPISLPQRAIPLHLLMDPLDISQPPEESSKIILRKHVEHQQQTRTRVRHHRLRITFFGYMVVLLFFGLLQGIGIFFFCKGFLLSRQVPGTISRCGDDISPCMGPPAVEKAVIVVVDALRFDFTIPVPESNEYYHNGLPILHQLAHDRPRQAGLWKFMADPPTTTMQRLKGLTTGSLPTFIDAGSNFNADDIDEDNWVLQLYNHNKTVGFMGDDTWQALFNKYIHPDLNFPYPLLNVWDIDTVDNGVLRHLHPLLENSRQWDVLVGHFLGVDHVGHRYGPNHPTMRHKLRQMNDEIAAIADKIDDKTLLVVMGDHGMDSTGNHGGDSPDEVTSALFMYLKSGNFRPRSREHYDISHRGANYRAVNQVDLVPTLSLLMGLPIPHNNLGFPIDEVFDEKLFNLAAFKTVQQINRFRHTSTALLDCPGLNLQYQHYCDNYHHVGTKKKFYAQLVEDARRYQAASLDHCKGLWARFDLGFIAIGLGVLGASFLFMLAYSRSIPSVRVSTMSFEFIGSVVAMALLGVVLSVSVYVVLVPDSFSLRDCVSIGVACGMIVGFWAPLMDRFSVAWLGHQVMDYFGYNFSWWSFMGLLFVLMHMAIFASNSFVIWEDKMVQLFVATFGACAAVAVTFTAGIPRPERLLGLAHAATLVVVSRLVSAVNLCREEQGGYCRPTFETSWWSVVLLHAVAFMLPLVLKGFYSLSDSYHSAAPLWIGSGLKFVLLLNAFYWSFEYLESHDMTVETRFWFTGDVVKSMKLAIARVVMVVTLVLANYSWSRGPLCVSIDIGAGPGSSGPGALGPRPEKDLGSQDSGSQDLGPQDPRPQDPRPQDPGPTPSPPRARILGHSNVYGSAYFLLVINFAGAIMCVSKPMAAICLAGLLVQILLVVELVNTLELRRNIIGPIMFLLMGYQHFFATGHQATIPSIQWEVGFMTGDTIMFPFTHLNILLNTLGPFILVCLCVPLITLWKIPPSNKPITVLSQVITVITSVMTYQTVISLSSFMFTAYFRRHLMVWKIFAPRFMMNGILLVVNNLVLVLVTLWFGSGKVLTQVNRIFGR